MTMGDVRYVIGRRDRVIGASGDRAKLHHCATLKSSMHQLHYKHRIGVELNWRCFVQTSPDDPITRSELC
jgi:hypothetical protein